MKKLIFIPLFTLSFNLFASEAQEFWSQFRTAFLAKDLNKLQHYADFPLTLNGTSDEDPIIKLNKNKFQNCFKHLFNKDTGLSSKPETHLDHAKTQTIINTKLNPDLANSFRVGDMTFQKKGKDYKLTIFYLETSEPEILKDCK